MQNHIDFDKLGEQISDELLTNATLLDISATEVKEIVDSTIDAIKNKNISQLKESVQSFDSWLDANNQYRHNLNAALQKLYAFSQLLASAQDNQSEK